MSAFGSVVRSFPRSEFVEFLVLADKDSTANVLSFSLCMHTYKPRTLLSQKGYSFTGDP